MSLAGKIARRTFVVAAVGGVVAAGAGFARLRWIDGYKLPAGAGETSFGAWLKFVPDGTVEVAVKMRRFADGADAAARLDAGARYCGNENDLTAAELADHAVRNRIAAQRHA